MIDRSRIEIRMCLFEGNEIDMETPLHQGTVLAKLVILWRSAAVTSGHYLKPSREITKSARGLYAIGG
jgi:hypothetical protein